MPAEHFTEGRFTYRFNTGFHQHMVESADGALAREPDTRFFQRISRDAYVWTGLANTRAWREFDLLMRMSALELPTPNVYACRVERQGLLYRAHILVERISHSGSLQQSLNKGEAATVDWLSVGRTVGQLGRHCIYHADLNSSNILLDESGNTHLIDFDRGKLMQGRMVKRYRSKDSNLPCGWRFLKGIVRAALRLLQPRLQVLQIVLANDPGAEFISAVC